MVYWETTRDLKNNKKDKKCKSWKELKADMIDYIKKCQSCQIEKSSNHIMKQYMVIKTTAQAPFQKSVHGYSETDYHVLQE